jgi:hypothetical protein
MRSILVLGMVIAALAAAGAASARTSASSACSRDFHHGGNHYLAIGRGIGCVQTMLIVSKLFYEPVIGHRTSGSITILLLRSPLTGWTCDAVGSRSKGAGCVKTAAKGAVSAVYVKLPN